MLSISITKKKDQIKGETLKKIKVFGLWLSLGEQQLYLKTNLLCFKGFFLGIEMMTVFKKFKIT